MGLVLTSPQLASSDPSVQADIGVGRIRITAIRHAFQSLTRSRTLREQHRYSRRRLHTQAGIAMSILVLYRHMIVARLRRSVVSFLESDVLSPTDLGAS